MQNLQSEILEAFPDKKLDDFTIQLSAMMDQKIAELENKFQAVQQQISQIKEEFNETVNHVEHDTKRH